MPRVPVTEEQEASSSRIADIGWIKIHYNDIGTGRPVVLLHGGGLGASSWSNFVLNIGELSKHFRVLAMDCPGYGKSDPWKPTGETRATVNARAVKGLIDSLGIDKVDIIGNSQGGASALTFAVDYPENTGKIIMMGAAPVGQRDANTPRLPSEGIRALSSLPRDPSFENFRRVFDLMVHDPSLVPDETLKRRAETINEEHRLNMLAQQDPSIARTPQRSLMEELPKVTAPILLIQGRNDTMVPPNLTVMLLPYLQNAELHMFNNCGHWAQYEHAGKFNRMAIDFLENDDD
jgi:2-hydroxy-6-oxonona-2,4-dienedioate hydrolase